MRVKHPHPNGCAKNMRIIDAEDLASGQNRSGSALNMFRQKLRAFVSDRDGNIVIAQVPNIPLIAWFLLLLASWWVSAQPWHDALAFFSAAFLFTWAWLELTQGESPVRRVFGAIVLGYLLVSRLLWA